MMIVTQRFEYCKCKHPYRFPSFITLEESSFIMLNNGYMFLDFYATNLVLVLLPIICLIIIVLCVCFRVTHC
ncbi:Uncharacterized protein TCM_034591 [Theobroma cacao]|uniref:Uncharacterized protein n=1 Tax=Theobroma cacao TaxID=3641 RepID=A0A061FFA1_THECC|nr:Uncharacterized protein TCM_034591 [Theobroma cacao]